MRRRSPWLRSCRTYIGTWLQCILWLLLVVAAPQHSCADVDFPIIEPLHHIYIEADTVAKETRGAYDVLAFDGHCKLRQGMFSAKADRIVLWIERRNALGMELPGKIVYLLEGNAEASWSNEQTGQDQRQPGFKGQRWMGRLFSLHRVDFKAEREVQRFDIPHLDWNMVDPRGPVQQAQFSQSVIGQPLAPPLLNTNQSSTNAIGNRQPFNAVAPNGSSSTAAGLPNTVVPSVPGAVPWTPNGSTKNSELVPSTGLVIPEDGSQPYPAAGIPTVPQEAVPPFPSQSQVALQVPVPTAGFGAKTIEFVPRDNREPSISYTRQENGESVGMVRGGFRLIVHDVQIGQGDGSVMDLGTVTLEADNAVIWLRGSESGLSASGFTSTAERPIEMYLDGNIVFYQGQRVIYADRMYYNVSSEYGMVLSAEVLTPMPQYQGLLRLKADVLQQRDRQNYMAYGAAFTSSRLGVPRYWMQANEVTFQDQRNDADLGASPLSDGTKSTKMLATSNSNLIYLGGLPVAYWPTFATDLAKPSFYLTSLKFKNDRILGTQVYTEFDAYQLLGINGPEGTNLTLSADYLSERGPAGGFYFNYNRPTILFGIPGTGFTDGWFIQDNGLDTLGSDRINMTPEKDIRGRIYSRHRLFVTPNVELQAQSGWISDRNIMEQYFEREWDQQKDYSTDLRFRRYNGNRMLDIWGQTRVNDFFTETEWLPRFDHYWLGQDLLNQRLTYSEHTNVGYAHQRVATAPTDPQDAAKFGLLDWENDVEGLRAVTRQELSMPISFSSLKVVPFLSGEAGYWGKDLNQNDVTRLTGQAGVKSSIPFWRTYPNFDSRLFDVRGIAHKVTLESEFFYADSTANLDQLPLFDPLDDNSQEHFRRRLIFNTFGGTLPPQFDERGYALRTGMQRWITASSSEIVDDMMQVRMGIDQRWQTKRGMPGKDRIVDLVSLDVDFIYFPQADRDNFGEEAGALNYNFRYHIGDRLTLLSDGYADFFSQGLKTVSAGARFTRPGRADAYIGLLSMEGPISSNVINGNLNYRLNEKWIFTGGAAFDLSSVGNVGQSLALTRIGESALIRVGMNVDSGRDNVSFNFNIEPRFLPPTRLGNIGGDLIPPAGLFGLE
jgi:hypothetical protein